MNLKQNFFQKTTVFVKLKSIANEQSDSHTGFQVFEHLKSSRVNQCLFTRYYRHYKTK